MSFIASFVPLILLCRKVWFGYSRMRVQMIRRWKSGTLHMGRKTLFVKAVAHISSQHSAPVSPVAITKHNTDMVGSSGYKYKDRLQVDGESDQKIRRVVSASYSPYSHPEDGITLQTSLRLPGFESFF